MPESIDTKEAYFLTSLLSLLDKCNIPNQPEVNENLKVEDSSSVAYQILYLTTTKKSNKSEITEKCEGLAQYIKPNGQIKLKKNKQDSSYEFSNLIFNTLQKCVQLQVQFEEDFVNKFVQSIQDNSQILYSSHRGWYEKELTNSVSLSLFSLLLSSGTNIQNLEEYINLFYDQPLGTVQDIYHYNQVKQHKIAVPFLPDTPINTDKQIVQVAFNFRDLSNEKVDLDAESLTIVIKRKDLVIDNLKVEKFQSAKKDYNYYVEIPKANIKDLGEYQIEITTKSPVATLFNRKFRLGQKIQIKELQFDIVEKNDQAQFLYKVKEGVKINEYLSANQNSFIHVQFKLEGDKKNRIPLQQVSVRLYSKEIGGTNLVQVEYDSKRDLYFSMIDLGNPDQIQPVNGEYDLQLIISDQKLIENKKWTFASVDVKFVKSIPKIPKDGDYTILPELAHTFSQPAESLPLYFVMSFVAIILLAFFFYLRILGYLHVNIDKLPKDSIVGWAFIGLLLSLFGLLTLFWTHLNLIEVIKYLGLLTIPFVIVGNLALIKSQEQDDQKEKKNQ